VTPIEAEVTGADYLLKIREEVADHSTPWGRRLEQYARQNLLVLRPIPTTASAYSEHLATLEDCDGSRISERLLRLLGRFSDVPIWMVELSVPDLFAANHRKLGEVLISADIPVGESRDFRNYLFARVPGFFVFRTGGDLANPEFSFVPSGVNGHDFGNFIIPDNFEDTFFFLVAELRDGKRQLVSRSVYWPRCLLRMSDEVFRRKYRAAPQPAITLDKGPWLKPQTVAQPTSLTAELVEHRQTASNRSRLRLRVSNTGKKPAFNTRIDIEAAPRAFYASDNFFWLAPGASFSACLANMSNSAVSLPCTPRHNAVRRPRAVLASTSIP
jgi:hypothetical protein